MVVYVRIRKGPKLLKTLRRLVHEMPGSYTKIPMSKLIPKLKREYDHYYRQDCAVMACLDGRANEQALFVIEGMRDEHGKFGYVLKRFQGDDLDFWPVDVTGDSFNR